MAEIDDMTPDSAAVAAIGRDVVARLRKLAEAATPGPWNYSKYGTQVLTGDSWNTVCVFWSKTGDKVIDHNFASWEDGRSAQDMAANAAYIAAASPDVILAFIARIEALEAENARLRAAAVSNAGEPVKVGKRWRVAVITPSRSVLSFSAPTRDECVEWAGRHSTPLARTTQEATNPDDGDTGPLSIVTRKETP